MRNRRYEQGGVVSFVVIAVVLASLLGAAIWWAKQARVSAPNTQDTVTLPGSSNTTSTTPQLPKTNETDGSADSQDSVTAPSTGPSSSEGVASTGPTAAEIPSTGPSDVLAIGLSVSAAGAGLYYLLQSRGRVRGAALK